MSWDHGARLFKSVLGYAFVVAALFYPGSIAAQSVPELAPSVNLSNTETTARFFAGARVASGPFTHSFQLTDTIQLQVQVAPESGHVGSAGKVYVLAIVGGIGYTLLEDD